VAKNYGNFQRRVAVDRSTGSVQRLGIVLESAFNWRGPEDGDPQALATKLRTAASGVERIPDVDPQLSDICRRLVDQAGKRAALLDAAKTNPEALRESNSNHGELDAAIKDYRAWLESKAHELGIE
jgi:hypothetical protein